MTGMILLIVGIVGLVSLLSMVALVSACIASARFEERQVQTVKREQDRPERVYDARRHAVERGVPAGCCTARLHATISPLEAQRIIDRSR